MILLLKSNGDFEDSKLETATKCATTEKKEDTKFVCSNVKVE